MLSAFFWDWLRGEESGSTTIRNLALVLAGAIALPLAGWRAVVADRQAKTAQQGLLNERYQKGAEMLGSEVLSVRLGGIYALQSLAEEYPDEYHVLVTRLFCAFVRLPTKDQSLESGQVEVEPGTLLGIRPDVEAAIEAINSRSEACIEVERKASFRLDLRGADLRGAQFLNADLSYALFQHANLSSANFANTALTNSILSYADISGSWFHAVDFTGTRFWYADLSGALLQDEELPRVDFSNAKLCGANLGAANLSGTNFQYATATKAWLEGATLSDASFLKADLSDASFIKADLSGATFPDASLNGANLSDANLSGVEFSNGGIQPAKVLTQAQLDEAWADSDNPPRLDGVLDAGTGQQLVWRAKRTDDPG